MAFDLSSVSRTKRTQSPRIFLYGVEGIGKSTFGAAAPAPVFIQTEDGLGSIETDSFPLASTLSDVQDAVRSLITQDHEWKSVVLDSADWTENLMWDQVRADHTESELAFGKGAVLVAEAWRHLIAGFDILRNQKGMNIIIIAHSQVKRFDDPVEGPYDRYTPKLQERSSALMREWADAVLFANQTSAVVKEDVGFNKKVSRAVSTGERRLFTSERPAYMAKNRYNMPESIRLSWEAFAEAIK